MSSLSLTPGAVFAGRYRIVRCIAQGGMGAVYEVSHTETERRCALKVMLPSLLQSDDMRARFRQEARVTARVVSEYIVDVLDAGIDDTTQTPYLVMELLQGEELQQRLRRLGHLVPHDVVTYLHQASLALDKTHRASIIHRDLKPSNFFLSEREDGSPRIKVFDFGIAKLVAEGATGAVTQTVGTPMYMAPEQFHFDVRLGPAVDIYALGMIAFTLLTGKPYWHDEASVASNPHAVYAAILGGPQEPAGARAIRRGVTLPPAFDGWFARITAVDPNARFPTASAAIVALGEVLGIHVAQRSMTPTPLRVEIKSIMAAQPQPHSLTAPVGFAHPMPSGIAAGSTTVVGSQAISMTPRALEASKKRGPGAAVALALGTVLVVASIAGSALLMHWPPKDEPTSAAETVAESAASSSTPAASETTNPAPSVALSATATVKPSAKPTPAPTPPKLPPSIWNRARPSGVPPIRRE